MVPLRITGFFLDHERMPVAVLSDPSGLRTLPVWVGPFEAGAIITQLTQVDEPRPVAHDILARHFRRHGFVMDSLEIHAASDGQGYSACIRYRHHRRRYRMDVPPSAGLALAVRLKAPILAARALLSAAGPQTLAAFLHDPSRGLSLRWAPEQPADANTDFRLRAEPLN